MKVLIVDEEIPYPLNTGKRLRTFNLVSRLAKSHEITYLCHGNSLAELPNISNLRFITVSSPLIPQQGLRFFASLAANIISPRPYAVDRHYSIEMSEALKACLDKVNFDLLHCEWTPYTKVLHPYLSLYPSVLATHNVEAVIWQRLFQMERNLFKKVYIWPQWQKMRRFEQAAIKLYDSVTAVSETDANVIRQWYGLREVAVVPNGVDESYFRPGDIQPEPYSMVFTGSMDWRPNQDAVKYFIRDIFPLIRREISTATLAVVGRNPPTWLKKLLLGEPGVVLTGTVDDVRPFMERAELYIVPLRIGGGSRLKILEALSMQKTVLSTSIGAEGLDLRDGEHIVLSDDARQFADAAVKILRTPHAFRHLGLHGREKVISDYTWDAIANVMETAWQQAVRNHHD